MLLKFACFALAPFQFLYIFNLPINLIRPHVLVFLYRNLYVWKNAI